MRFVFFGIISFLFFQACVPNRFKVKLSGMQMYQQLFYYQLIKGNSSERIYPPVGAEVRIDYRILKDSIVLDESYTNYHPTLVQIPTQQYDNFFTKALKLMAKGDSLRVMIQAEKIPDMLGDYATRFDKKDWVIFDFKLQELTNESKMKAQILKEQQFLDSLRKVVPSKIDAFFKGEQTNYARSNSGIFYEIYELGLGPTAQHTDAVSVHYLCFASTGVLLDDSYRNMVPLHFKVGHPSLIKGFSETVKLLREGSRGLFFIPPELAYGQLGSGGAIMPNTFVAFYIEMMEIN